MSSNAAGAGAGILQYDAAGEATGAQEIDTTAGAFLVSLDVDPQGRGWGLRRVGAGLLRELLGFEADGDVFFSLRLDPIMMAAARIAAPNELFNRCRTYEDLRILLDGSAVKPRALLHGLRHKLEQSETAYGAGKLRKAGASLCQFARKVAGLAPRHVIGMS